MLLLSVVDNDSVQTATQSINNYTIHSYTLLSAHGFVIKVTDFHLRNLASHLGNQAS